MRLIAPLILALLAPPILTGCPGLSASDKAEFKKIQDQMPELRTYAIDTKSMAEVYKKIKDKEEGKIKPRMIGTVLSVLPANDPSAADLIKENNLPNVPGASVAIIYTPHGWSVMLAKPGLEIKENQVVEFTLPAAADFDDLDNQEKIKTKLTELQTDGSVGIQSVREDCIGNTSGNGPFAMTCNGAPAEFVVNASQFSQSTLDWLNNPNKPVPASSNEQEKNQQ
ncbi:hypothetical protein [Chitinivorax sp. B]|uniref:hypothetical protein n=1 Tax=Chitinivorax sp. B TaxID=2502235 RepID=UPI0010F800A4|nr:hypothetical protein [Chitinivorax sp. B]